MINLQSSCSNKAVGSLVVSKIGFNQLIEQQLQSLKIATSIKNIK